MLNRRKIECFITLTYCYGVRDGPDGAEAWDGVLIGAFTRDGAEAEIARLHPDWPDFEVKSVSLDTDCYSMDVEDFITICVNTTEEN